MKVMKKSLFVTCAITLVFVAFYACEKKETAELPSVVTASVDGITANTAKIGGKVTDNGGADITERGVYWGTSVNPDTSGTKLQLGNGMGTFYDTLRSLTSGMKYYVKAYATNEAGTAFGDQTFFTTQVSLPIVTTTAVSEITPTSAKVGGAVTDDGGHEVTARGLFWGTTENAIVNGTKLVLGNGKGEFSQTLSNLSKGVTYYVRSFATNSKGTAYGDEISFSTVPELPSIFTSIPTYITGYTATVGGSVGSDGGAPVTERGIYWGLTPETQTSGAKVIVGSGLGSFDKKIESLTAGTIYYVKAYGINAAGTAYGEEKTFTTLGEIPTAATLSVSDITSGGATLNGVVNSKELSTVVTFEYGTTTSYGASVTAKESPGSGNADSTFSAEISGLTPNTLYHFRVKAVNDLGTVYGADSTFKTVITGISGSVIDADGNTYATIGIGYQQWMTENLKTTKYSDGTTIPLVKKDSLWALLNSPGYCWDTTITNYKNDYGLLYNWYVVSSDKLCPIGWRVPTDGDLKTLVNYLGGAGEAGGSLKEVGISLWRTPNTGATNKVGFKARPGGVRNPDGVYDFTNVEGHWWSSTEFSSQNASNIYILYLYSNTFEGYTNKRNGLSVRCVKE